MSSVTVFLESISDCELAFLYAYKYETYLETPQMHVKDALLSRGLDISRIQGYIKEYTFNPANDGCPRCNSQKFLEDGIQCAICEYRITDEEERQKPDIVKITEALLRIVGKGH